MGLFISYYKFDFFEHATLKSSRESNCTGFNSLEIKISSFAVQSNGVKVNLFMMDQTG